MTHLPTWMSLCLILAVTGCRARGNVDLLEAQLRRQEDRLLALNDDLTRAQNELAAARRESDSLRNRLTENGHQVLLPEQADATFRTERIEINRMLTGGLDRDDVPGDDQLVTVISPLDGNGKLVKVPAAIELELLDLSAAEGRQRIGRWEFGIDESDKHWHSGLLASGYQFKLPWQQAPQSKRLLLHARLMTSDGRQFDATQEIRVTPAASVVQGPAELLVPPPEPAVPATPTAKRSSAAGRPFPWAADSAVSGDSESGVRHASGSAEVEPPQGDVGGDALRPAGGAPLRTSDRWTSDEIPVYR